MSNYTQNESLRSQGRCYVVAWPFTESIKIIVLNFSSLPDESHKGIEWFPVCYSRDSGGLRAKPFKH